MGNVLTFGIAGFAYLEGERLVVVDAEHQCIVRTFFCIFLDAYPSIVTRHLIGVVLPVPIFTDKCFHYFLGFGIVSYWQQQMVQGFIAIQFA